jgi:hypothetical protein
MNNLYQGCRIFREDFLETNAQCNHEGAIEHCLPIDSRIFKGHIVEDVSKFSDGGNKKSQGNPSLPRL